MNIPRRRFVQGSTAAVLGSVLTATGGTRTWGSPTGPRQQPTDPGAAPDGAAERIRLVPLSARLAGSRWQQQVEAACEEYLAVGLDDLLHGFRTRADLPAPGQPLTGWASSSSEIVFGQIMSGMARLSHHLDDDALRERAVAMYEGWRETVPDDGNVFAGAYGLDKYVCGMVDLQLHTGHETLPYLKKVLADALQRINPARPTANAVDWDGRNPGGQNEWYTLSENAYRAHLVDPDPGIEEFARFWHYPALWDRFTETAEPSNPPVAHAYSHVNSFNGAAMAYAVTGEQRMLDAAVNAHDWITATQTFATGGYGPIEHLVTPGRGRLGSAVEHSINHAEIGCGTWGGFKLSTYLTQLTGEARFLDWAERLLYNGVGAALPADREGHAFYYADYGVGGGRKIYYGDTWPCCAGTYLQDMAAYHEMLYYQDTEDHLYVALYLPSTTETTVAERRVTLTTETGFPESEQVVVRVGGEPTGTFALSLRVPGWCGEPALSVNGGTVRARAEAGWLRVEREWRAGDEVRLELPMVLRREAVDPEHPHRTAFVTGPVVLAQESPGSGRWLELDSDPGTLTERVLPTSEPLTFEVLDLVPEDNAMPRLRPFYTFTEDEAYRLYTDSDAEYAFQPATEAGGARFELENVGSGRRLGIADGSQRDGALADAGPDTGREDQYWRFTDRGEGAVAVHNVQTDRFLGLERRSRRVGTRVAVWEPERAAADDGAWTVQEAGPGTVHLLNVHSGKALALDEDGQPVQAAPSRRRQETQWRFRPYGDIMLVNRNSWRALDIIGGEAAAGAGVQQWFKSYSAAQKFQFQPAEDGWLVLIDIIEKLALTAVPDGSGEPVQVREQDGGPEQQWRLTPVEGTWFTLTNRSSEELLVVQDGGRADGDLLTLGGPTPGRRDHLWRLD